MRSKITGRRAAVVVAGIAATAIAVPFGSGSSHREAPNIMLDPSADNTDTYAFTADDEPNALTVVANWVPGEVPANGPNFFRFDDRAKYYINIDNDGDGVADIKYKYKFKTELRHPESFLYAGPNTEDFNDDSINVFQTYKLIREEVPSKGNVNKREVIGKNLPVAPPNIGPKTFPKYQQFVNRSNVTLGGGTKTFAGQRDDPFFVDLGATFDSLNIRQGTGNEGQGKDDFSGYGIESTVLQVPESDVTRNGNPVGGPNAPNAVVGVWSSTERRKLEFTSRDFDKGAGKKNDARGKNRFVQVSRLGNPLVNEVIIPLGKKDKFNRTSPDRDLDLYGKFVLRPELAAYMNELFDVGAPQNGREDIVQAVLQGIPDLNQHSGKFQGTPVDTLKLNLGVPPSNSPSRFGVIGGDNAGYPNGRRLIDDVVDIDLQVVAGILVGNEVPLGDGVDQNDKPFLSRFPYLAAPDSGFESNPSQRVEPPHQPVPPGGN